MNNAEKYIIKKLRNLKGVDCVWRNDALRPDLTLIYKGILTFVEIKVRSKRHIKNLDQILTLLEPCQRDIFQKYSYIFCIKDKNGVYKMYYFGKNRQLKGLRDVFNKANK